MKALRSMVLLLIVFLAAGGVYYATFPALNIHEPGIVILLIMLLFMIGIVLTIAGGIKKKKKKIIFAQIDKLPMVFFVSGAALILVLIIGLISGSTLFRAKSYASLLKVEEYDFAESMPEVDSVDNIALMDTSSAKKFGNRMIGSLSDVVSQYDVNEEYVQINISGKPYKVSVLDYASFFKYWKNKNKGIPGYVKVNPVNSKAEYIKFEKPLKYVPSAYFNNNLQRHVQFKYPTKIFSGYYFEVDNEGNPYFVCPVETAKVGLFDGRDVIGAVLCDPVTGDCKYYKAKEIPSWVDRVYDGDLLVQKYDWHGSLSGGFFNSIISQTGCKMTTDDYGYITIEDDVWVYTGVTSLNGDKSNVGFVMMNQRTSEARYYVCSGAEEHSAMSAAEGEVQEKGYQAAFPSLINVSGSPAYVMVLKDAGGLVKMYAIVNVEQYNIVATATTQEEVFKKYKKLLASNGTKSDDLDEEKTLTNEIVIKEVNYIVNDGVTTVYVKDSTNKVYKQAFSENEQLAMLTAGQTVKMQYEDVEEGISFIVDFEIIDQGLESEPKETSKTEENTEEEGTNETEGTSEAEKTSETEETSEAESVQE